MANCVFGFSWREGRGRREAEFYFELDERQTQTQGVAVKMPARVSVEAVRRQLEMMGRDVPQDLISSFLKDLGVEPVSENGGRTAQEAEDRYEDDYEDDDYEEEEEEEVCRQRVEVLVDSTVRRSPAQRLGGSRKENLSPLARAVGYPDEDDELSSRPVTSPGLRRERLVSSPSRCLSARSSNRLSYNQPPQQPAKTDRVARYQKTQMSWKTCSSAQLGKKSKPAINFHKLFAAQHAEAAKKTRRAVQSGRRKPLTRDREYVVPTEKRRDNVRWEVRQSLRHRDGGQ